MSNKARIALCGSANHDPDNRILEVRCSQEIGLGLAEIAERESHGLILASGGTAGLPMLMAQTAKYAAPNNVRVNAYPFWRQDEWQEWVERGVAAQRSLYDSVVEAFPDQTSQLSNKDEVQARALARMNPLLDGSRLAVFGINPLSKNTYVELKLAIDKGIPCIALATRSEVKEQVLRTAAETDKLKNIPRDQYATCGVSVYDSGEIDRLMTRCSELLR